MMSRTVTMGCTAMPYSFRSSSRVEQLPCPRSIRSTETNRLEIFTGATFWNRAMDSRTAVPAVTTSSTMAMTSPAWG